MGAVEMTRPVRRTRSRSGDLPPHRGMPAAAGPVTVTADVTARLPPSRRGMHYCMLRNLSIMQIVARAMKSMVSGLRMLLAN